MNDFCFLETNSKLEGFASLRKTIYGFLSFFRDVATSSVISEKITNNAVSQKHLCLKSFVVEKTVTCVKLELDISVNITEYMI